MVLVLVFVLLYWLTDWLKSIEYLKLFYMTFGRGVGQREAASSSVRSRCQ